MKRILAIIALSVVSSGCLFLPVPTPGHTIGSSVPTATMDEFQPGKVSRTDVLLSIGEPTRRAQDDRYLVYGWTVVYGYGLLFIGAGGGGELFPLPVAAPNYLCLEFGSDAVLVRKVNLRGSFYENPGNAMNACEKGLEEGK